jgi:hypothetical protein
LRCEFWVRLEVVGVADGHAGWSFDGLGGDELFGVAVEVVDAVDEGGAVDGFGGVPLLEEIVEVRAGDGSGLGGGLWVDGEGEHGFEGTELYGAPDLGGHGVAGVCLIFGGHRSGFGDGFEDAAEAGCVGEAHVVLDEA